MRTAGLSSMALAVAAVVVAGCSCSSGGEHVDAGSDGGGDAGRDAAELPNDAGCVDGGACVVDMAPALAEINCLGSAQMVCQEWAESRAPALDAVSACSVTDGCMRADQCVVTRVDAGVDGGTSILCGNHDCLVECRCGDGPPCEPGLVCARPIGSDGPRECICPCGV